MERKTKNKGGRPRKKITRDAFQKLCKLQCTAEEIAGLLDCSVDTLGRWVKKNYDGETFAVVYKKYAAGGRASLRRRQGQNPPRGKYKRSTDRRDPLRARRLFP